MGLGFGFEAPAYEGRKVSHSIYREKCEIVKELDRAKILILKNLDTGKTFHVDEKVIGTLWIYTK